MGENHGDRRRVEKRVKRMSKRKKKQLKLNKEEDVMGDDSGL